MNAQIVVPGIALCTEGVLDHQTVILLDLLIELANEFFSRKSSVLFVFFDIAALNTAIELIDGSVVILYSGSSQIPRAWT